MAAEPGRQVGGDAGTLVDALAVAWKFPAGAITVIGGAITLPTLGNRPDLVSSIGGLVGLAMAAVGVIVTGVVLFERKRHSAARAAGLVLGAVTLVPMGLFLAGLMPGLPTPRQVSETIRPPSEQGDPPPRASFDARGRLRLTIEAAPQADRFAEALRRRVPAALERERIGGDPRAVTVAATASGRWADAAARLYVGRLDVRMRADGAEGVCEFALNSTGRQTVEVAAGQVADQLAPRIAALMQGDEQC